MKLPIDNFINIANKFFIRISYLTGIGRQRKKRYRNYNIIQKNCDLYRIEGQTVALDIGSGPIPKNPFLAKKVYGADLRSKTENNVVHADLSTGQLPFENNSFDYVTAYDVLEHIPRISSINNQTTYPFILLMNEIFRVLKPGGVFFNIQPCYPSKDVFQDPTHVNIITEDTLMLYFCESAWARIYGYTGSFNMLADGWIGAKYFSFLRKSHDLLIHDLDFIQK